MYFIVFPLFRTRLQWLGAFRSAIDHANELVRYQRAAMDKRRIARQVWSLTHLYSLMTLHNQGSVLKSVFSTNKQSRFASFVFNVSWDLWCPSPMLWNQTKTRELLGGMEKNDKPEKSKLQKNELVTLPVAH